MADIAASVLARLKNKAAESGRSYQLCLQLFCQEEFLRRLEKSKYAENLVLKGGIFQISVSQTKFHSIVSNFRTVPQGNVLLSAYTESGKMSIVEEEQDHRSSIRSFI